MTESIQNESPTTLGFFPNYNRSEVATMGNKPKTDDTVNPIGQWREPISQRRKPLSKTGSNPPVDFCRSKTKGAMNSHNMKDRRIILLPNIQPSSTVTSRPRRYLLFLATLWTAMPLVTDTPAVMGQTEFSQKIVNPSVGISQLDRMAKKT